MSNTDTLQNISSRPFYHELPRLKTSNAPNKEDIPPAEICGDGPIPTSKTAEICGDGPIQTSKSNEETPKYKLIGSYGKFKQFKKKPVTREQDAGRSKTLEPGLVWAGPGEDRILVKFDAKSFFWNRSAIKDIGKNNNMTFRLSGDAQIMKDILKAHGFTELPGSSRFSNFSWIGNSITQLTVDTLKEYQTINHFVGSTHLTRKDQLYKNVSKLKNKRGKQQFDFLPISFIMPKDKGKFKVYCKKNNGPFIVKPVGLSRGRGVYLINNPKELAANFHEDDMVIVSKYVDNPLLIDGYKTDIRLYVLVTSFNPLVIYLYQEGLTRFATVKYNKDVSNNISALRMHLTNYSINACSGNYIKNEDSSIEDFGSKWTLSALLRYFQTKGVDTIALMERIEDVVVKTVLSVENICANLGRIYQHKPSNCFEIFGFDILLDQNYKPWLLEVNLSPSLVCSTPLDIKVKANMLCDLLNLVGVEAYAKKKPVDTGSCFQAIDNYLHRTVGYFCTCQFRDMSKELILRPRKYYRASRLLNTYVSGGSLKYKKKQETQRRRLLFKMTKGERNAANRHINAQKRVGGWVKLFPIRNSWQKYRHFLQYLTSKNATLHQQLYPDQHADWFAPKRKPVKPDLSPSETAILKNCKRINSKWMSKETLDKVQRIKRYHSKLENGPPPLFRVKTVGRDYVRLDEDMGLEDDVRRTLLNEVAAGRIFTEVQARTAFLTYLTYLKQTIRDVARTTDVTTNPTVPVIQDLLFQMLGQCSDLTLNDNETDVDCTLDSCLTGFLYHYHQETRSIMVRNEADKKMKTGEDKTFVTPSLFEEFVHSANPWEIEELLMAYVLTHGDVSIFLKNRIQNSMRFAAGDDSSTKTRDRLWVPTRPDAGEIWTTV